MQLDEWHLFQFSPFNMDFLNFLALAAPHQPRFAQQLPPGGSQGRFAPAGRQVGDPSGAAAQKLTEVSSSLNGTSFRNCPLASPGGKLDFLTSGTSEPIGKKA